MQRKDGWSVLELMIVLGVVSVLAGFAVAGVRHARAAVHSAQARQKLEESFRLAGRGALIDRLHYVVCSSADGTACNNDVAWEHGWIVFADKDRDRQPDAGRPIARRETSLGDAVRLRGTRGRTRVVFQPAGRAAGGSNASFTLCDHRGPGRAARLVLSQRGNLRAMRADPAKVADCP